MIRNFVAALAIASCMPFAGSIGEAQVLTGTMFGQVKDPSGSSLPGVTAELTSPALPGGPQVAITNERGEYRFQALPPGAYRLKLDLGGFATYEETGLVLTSGGTVERNIAMQVATLSETITVSGQSPIVDTRQTAVAVNIAAEKIEAVPFQHYSLQDLAEMLPGVSQSAPGADWGGQTKYVMGSLANETGWVIDGVNANNPRTGSFWVGGDPDSIQEAQVTAVGASAEYQIAQGGVLSYVIKSGTNDFRGRAAADFRPDAFVSKPIKVTCNCSYGSTGYSMLDYRDNNVNLGGPIMRDRLWFFAAGHWKGLTALNPGQNPDLLPDGTYVVANQAVGKVTFRANDRIRVNSMVEREPWREPPFPDLANPLSTIPIYYGRNWMYSNEVVAMLPRDAVLTVRATGFTQPGDGVDGNMSEPARTDLLTGIASGGVASISLSQSGRHGVAAKMSKYISGPSLNLSAGFQSDRANAYSASVRPFGVNYTDSGGAPVQAVAAPPSVTGANFNSWAGWVDAQVTRAWLTFQGGVRYDQMAATSPDIPAVDLELKPTGEMIDGLGDLFTWKTLSPRGGVTAKLTSDGKTVLRASVGRYYSPVFLNTIDQLHPGVATTVTAGYNASTGGYTDILQVVNPRLQIDVSRDIKPQYNTQYSVGVDREVGNNMALSINWVHKDGNNQLGWTDTTGIYQTQPVTLTTGQVLNALALVNAPSARRFVLTNPEPFYTRYDGLMVGFNKRYANRWLASTYYTFSRSRGMVPGGGSFGQDPNDYINLDGRLANVDRPHNFNAQMTYEIPKIDLRVGSNVQLESGVVFPARASVRLPQGTRNINIEGPGGDRTPKLGLVSLRFARDAWRRGSRSASLSLDIKNLFQSTAHQQVISNNYASALFGQPRTWIPPRQATIGIRVAF